MSKNNYNKEKDKENRYKNNIEMIRKFVEYKKELESEGKTNTKEYKETQETDKKLNRILQHSESNLYDEYMLAMNDSHIPHID